MKVLNHISIKMNIVFPHLPIGVGGSRVCQASWSLERRFVWFNHSRDAFSDLMKVSNHISTKMNIVFPHFRIGAGGSRVCRPSSSLKRCSVWFDPSRDFLSGFITRETLYLIWWKCQIKFTWIWTLYFLTPYRGRRVQSVSGILITRLGLVLVLSLERSLVWFYHSRGALSHFITREVLGLIR